MEATLPPSAVTEAVPAFATPQPTRAQAEGGAGSPARQPECRVPARKAALAEAHAPNVLLPLRFIASGLASLLLAVLFLIAQPSLLAGYHYNQYIIAVTHLLVLGFGCSIVMGAVYQLVPVALESRLYSEKLARWNFVAHVIGFAGMVWMFWIWNMKQVGHFGTIFALGVGWFVYNISRTLARAPKWDVVAWSVASVLTWLSFTVLAGLFLATTKCWTFSPFDTIAAMHAHAHLGIVGVFILLIVGVSYKLVPMFALSEIRNHRRALWSVGLINVGLAGAVTTVLLQSSWKLAFGLVLATGLAVYGVELRAILAARKRRSLDWGMKTFLTALGLLAPLSMVGVLLAWPGLPANPFFGQLENVYGFLAVFGVVALAILAMLHKILPFLIWYRVYSPWIGKAKVPALAEMSSIRLQVAGHWTYLAALVLLSVGIILGSEPVVRFGAVVLASGMAFFFGNFAMIVSHLARPRVAGATTAPAAPRAVQNL